MAKALNPKQQKFVERYLATGNATQSYIDAGYTCSRASAEAAAARLLGNIKVQAELGAATQSAIASAGTSAAWTLAYLKVLALYDGPRSSHMARVAACKAILEHHKPDPPAAATNVSVNVSTDLAARIDWYEVAFARAADRNELAPAPGAGTGGPHLGPT